MAVLRKILIMTLPVILCGCYGDFDPKTDVKPVLCLNSLIVAGEPMDIKVSHTWLYSEGGAGRDSVSDAVVRIYVNGDLKTPDYIPREGDHIRISAESDTYGSAIAEVTIPEAVDIKALRFEPILTDMSINDTDRHQKYIHLLFDLKVEFEVPEHNTAENNYRLIYDTFSKSYPQATPGEDINRPDDEDLITESWLSLGNPQYNSDNLFSAVINGLPVIHYYNGAGCTFFADKKNPGNEFTLKVSFPDCHYITAFTQWEDDLIDCGYVFSLQRISNSFINLIKYQSHNIDIGFGDLADLGLADPVGGYSNVSSGAGVVAALSSSTLTVNLHDFLKETLPDSIYTKSTRLPDNLNPK